MKVQSTDDQPAMIVELVKGELIALGWRSSITLAFVGPLLIVGLYFGIEGRVSAQSLWIWLSIMASFMALRLTMVSLWIIRKPRGMQRPRWGWYFFATMLLSVGFWGTAAPVFLPQLEPLWQAFIIAMTAGICGGSVAAFSPHRPSMIIVTSVMLLPLAATLFLLGGEAFPILGIFCVIYYFYLLRASSEHHKIQAEALRLRFERSEMVDKLSAARDAAEQANETKSLFLANMSHELRTPLNAIMGFSEMIKLGILGKEKTAQQVEYAELIHGSGAHLLDLINDLLDVSKAEAGKLDLHEEELDLGDLVENCLQLLGPAAMKANVQLQGPKSKKTINLFADARKLRQILINLLSNAMKFTPEGGHVSISYAIRPEYGVTISVADSGIGMTQEQLERAMQPFVQIEQGYDSAVPGTGLGLPLSKTLAELHDGSLEMQSVPETGTTAIVHLPAERLRKSKRARTCVAA